MLFDKGFDLLCVQAVKEQLRGYEKGVAAAGKKKSVSLEAEMIAVQAQLKGYSEVFHQMLAFFYAFQQYLIEHF